MFEFRVHPAGISVTDGVQHAWEYLTRSWRLWGWVVLALAVANSLFMLLVAGVMREGLTYVDEANEIRLVGKIDYDETRVKNITAWVPGRG